MLYTTTMQKVACAITIVSTPNGTPNVLIVEFNAIAVTIPGSAIGSTRRKETVFRPKNRNRCTANAAALPKISAITVANNATWSELISAPLTCAERNAIPNHFVV